MPKRAEMGSRTRVHRRGGFRESDGAAKAAASAIARSACAHDRWFVRLCLLSGPPRRRRTSRSTASAKLEQLRNRTGLPFSTEAVAGADISSRSTTDTSIQQSIATTVERDIAELSRSSGASLSESLDLLLQHAKGSRWDSNRSSACARRMPACWLPQRRHRSAEAGAIAINCKCERPGSRRGPSSSSRTAGQRDHRPDGQLPTGCTRDRDTRERGPGLDEIAGAWNRASASRSSAQGDDPERARTRQSVAAAQRHLQGKATPCPPRRPPPRATRVARGSAADPRRAWATASRSVPAFMRRPATHPAIFARAFPARSRRRSSAGTASSGCARESAGRSRDSRQAVRSHQHRRARATASDSKSRPMRTDVPAVFARPRPKRVRLAPAAPARMPAPGCDVRASGCAVLLGRTTSKRRTTVTAERCAAPRRS